MRGPNPGPPSVSYIVYTPATSFQCIPEVSFSIAAVFVSNKRYCYVSGNLIYMVGTSKDIGPGGQISAHRCPTDLKLIPNEADGKLSK